jgi:uncharacterized protein YbaP (TraB family)
MLTRAGPVHAQATSASDVPAEITITGERPGPGLWRVTAGDHTLWLLGVVEPLPRRMTWRSATVDATVARAEVVLPARASVKVDAGPFATIALYFNWRRTSRLAGSTTLKDVLPAPLYARFETQKARFDPDDSRIEELRPAFAALRLYQQAMDAAGLSWHDTAEESVLKLAAQRHVPVRRAMLSIDDPSGALKEVSELPPSVEVNCLETTITRLENDLPHMQERAAAWAVGDVDRLRQLSFADQREACVSALSNAPRMRALFERAAAAWNNDAEWALMSDKVSFAMRPIYELLAPDGPLAKFRAEGYTVEGP